MSKAEDYLDGLLNSMGGKKEEGAAEPEPAPVAETPKTAGISLEDDFLNSFEKELLAGDDTDDFIRQFERELAEENQIGAADADSSQEDAFFENLDGIVNSVKNDLSGKEALPEPDMDIMVDTIGDISGADMGIPDISQEPLPEFPGAGETSGLAEDDQDLMDLLHSDGDFSDIGDMLKADEENQELSEDGPDAFADFSLGDMGISEAEAETASEEETDTKGKKRKKREKKQKMAKEEGAGFVQKISNILFGEEEQEKAAEPVKVPAVTAPSIEELSDENLEILKELEGMQMAEEPQAEPEETEDPKEKKKREKKEKKEKAKREKKEKKSQAKKVRTEKKAKKAKKPKAPKEPDNTPPLPKKPVILVFVMAASFLALVLVGTNLFGYSNSIETAKQKYELGEYETAFQELCGLELKEQDQDTYKKYSIMANASGEYSAYQSFMENGIYDMALDSLVRTVGRCDKYQADAEEYGCTRELERVRTQAAGALSSFGITEERALELYAIDDRITYSMELGSILTQAGLSND